MKRFGCLCLLMPLLAFSTMPLANAFSQTSAAKQVDSKKPPADEAPESPGEIGFSMESEILTYMALQRDAEAIGCHVARFLEPTPAHLQSSPDTTLCETATSADHNVGVLIIAPNSKLLSEFGIWRSDMAIMDLLLYRAGIVGCEATLGSEPLSTLPGQALSLATPWISMAQDLLSTNESTVPVRGTVEHVAFMNAVARQLRRSGVPVLMPDIYMPFSLSSMDRLQYPFLLRLEKVEALRPCLLNKAGGQGALSLLAAEILRDMDAFLVSVLGWPSGTALGTTQSKQPDATSKTGEAAPSQVEIGAPSRLVSLLSIDLMVKELGIGQSGKPKQVVWQHVLWLKALESGGSVMKTGKFLGTKVRYGGGAVVSYVLFNLQGEVECAGNVFDYGQALRDEDLSKKSPSLRSRPDKKLLDDTGCQALPGATSPK